MENSTSEGSSSLLRLPLELLTEVANFLPLPLDIFALRGTCKELHVRLGRHNATLWKKVLAKSKVKRPSILDGCETRPGDYFNRVNDVLSGREPGCQICLRSGFLFDVYRGRIFYKTLCEECKNAQFYTSCRDPSCPKSQRSVSPLICAGVQLYAGMRVTCNADLSTLDAEFISDYLSFEVCCTSGFLAKDVDQAIKEQLGSLGRDPRVMSALESERQKFLWMSEYIIEKTIAARKAVDIIIPLVIEEYERHSFLHHIKSVEEYSAECYGAFASEIHVVFEGLRYMDSDFSSLMHEYLDSESLCSAARERNIKQLIALYFEQALQPGPNHPEVLESPEEISPILLRWITKWLIEGPFKKFGVNHQSELWSAKELQCPFCEKNIEAEGSRVLTYTAVHIWGHHPDRMDEGWDLILKSQK